jgi:hypothetical protein
MNCRTCHQIHTEFEADDYALTTTDPVMLMITGETVDVSGDDTPGSNLCAECHQGRTRGGWPDWQAPVDQMFEITSPHYGVHSSPQVNVYTTKLDPLFEFGVDEDGPFGFHEDVSCNGCHMGLGVEDFDMPPPTPGGELGHTWEAATEVCGACHDAVFNYDGVQEEVAGMLEELGMCLEAEGVIDLEDEDIAHRILADHGGFDAPEYHPVTGMHPEPYVAAYLVYNSLIEDGSFGVHQPDYVEDLAEAALTYMQDNSELCPVMPEQFSGTLTELNGSGVSGSVTFTVDSEFRVSVDASGLVPSVLHPQHVHSAAACPTAGADANGDGYVDVVEGVPSYGGILVNLDSDLLNYAADTFPTATAGGMVSYMGSAALGPFLTAIGGPDSDPTDPLVTLDGSSLSMETRTYVIHGIDPATDLPGTVASLGDVPPQVTLPVACATISTDG